MPAAKCFRNHAPAPFVGSLAFALALGAAPLLAQQDGAQPQAGQQQPDAQRDGAGQQRPSSQQPTAGGPADQEAFAKRFWAYLQKADYRKNWSRWPGHDEEFSEGRQGQSPHGDLLKIYINPKAESSLTNPLAESVIVKENYNDDEELVSITPMYRIDAEYDPPNKNWYWAMYKPNGSLFEVDGKKMSGKLESCIECHVSAGGRDYVFNNDPEEEDQ